MCALTMAKILVVEDDTALGQIICDEMRIERHLCEIAASGVQADEKLRDYEFELVILDWDLPGLPGIQVLANLRNRGKTVPVLMLTGKSQLKEKEEGLDAGADDYLTKPFQMRELSARVRALLRRAANQLCSTLCAGDLLLDPSTHCVRRVGQDILLTPKEYALLEYFMRNKNKVLSTEAILNHVWPSEAEASVETLRVWLKRLRSKIDVEGEPSKICTIHGAGYTLKG